MKNLKRAYDAIKAGDFNVLETLVNAEPELVRGSTPFGPLLHVAATTGNITMLSFLIERGAGISVRGGIFDGNALNQAAASNQPDAVGFLLEKGAEMELDEPEHNPLFSAINQGSLDIVKLLIKHGINASIKYTGDSMKNMDAVAFAKELGRTEIAEYLESCG